MKTANNNAERAISEYLHRFVLVRVQSGVMKRQFVRHNE